VKESQKRNNKRFFCGDSIWFFWDKKKFQGGTNVKEDQEASLKKE